MSQILFRNARVFDGHNADCAEGAEVLVEDGTIREVSDRPIVAASARIINVGGRTLMPGMIDAHTHAYASDVNVQKVEAHGEAYRSAYAARMLGHALDCGFTTIRDVGGGEYCDLHDHSAGHRTSNGKPCHASDRRYGKRADSRYREGHKDPCQSQRHHARSAQVAPNVRQ